MKRGIFIYLVLLLPGCAAFEEYFVDDFPAYGEVVVGDSVIQPASVTQTSAQTPTPEPELLQPGR